MPYDLAISEHGDLILAGNRDLAGMTSVDLLNQRIKIRLKIHRGSWYYDTDGTLGSFLFQVVGKDPQSDLQIESYVREGLRAMQDEISLEEISHEYDPDTNSVVVHVLYTIQSQTEGVGLDISEEPIGTTIQIPLTQIGG